MPQFTLRQLECLATVGQEGSIAAAAAALNLSASAITGALNELERVLNTQLTIRRKAHGVSLTPSGRYVLQEAQGILQASQDLQQMAHAAGTLLAGRVRVGCYSSLAPTVLPELLAAYSSRYSQVEVDFFAGTQQEIFQRLANGTLDLAFVYDFGLPEDVERTTLYMTEPNVLLPPDHPLARSAKVSLAQLAEEPMILLDVPPSREHTEALFEAAGVSPWIRYRTADFEVTRSMVARGLGYAVLVQRPAADVSYEGLELAVRSIHPVTRRVRITVVRAQSVRPSKAAAAMFDLALELHPRR
ncbi:LysR substrate-binding domain-containing protein [Glutamicibacter sp.]|uniref:LysR substrate-binding domain-containing protein n=1 Tax=Glutamicibacter sp. TaxID=1931995 RepID=UPI0028BD5250|nr:LysR substrate-binding domain-containing protein [Glutamicibacter sp.]